MEKILFSIKLAKPSDELGFILQYKKASESLYLPTLFQNTRNLSKGHVIFMMVTYHRALGELCSPKYLSVFSGIFGKKASSQVERRNPSQGDRQIWWSKARLHFTAVFLSRLALHRTLFSRHATHDRPCTAPFSANAGDLRTTAKVNSQLRKTGRKMRNYVRCERRSFCSFLT